MALGITGAEESTLKLQEFICSSDSSCSWQVLVGNTVDTAANKICGRTSKLGTFGITRPDVLLTPPTNTCVGAADEPVQLATDPNVCSVAVDNHNQIAGGCEGGGGGLASCLFDGAVSEALSLGAHTVDIVATANDGSTATCSSYVSVADRQQPQVGPAPSTVECTGATTQVDQAASCGDNCGACNASCGSGAFPLGTTPIACNATDASGNRSACATSVQIVDTRAPTLTLAASPLVLWPPNHKLVGINLTRSTTDSCDVKPVVTCSATSSEPDNGLGDGDTANDIQWLNGNLLLRSDRRGTGADRTYTITCTAKDASGNSSTTSTKVTVPHG